MPREACALYWSEEFPWELCKSLGATYAQGFKRKSRSMIKILARVSSLGQAERMRVFSSETILFL